MTKQRTALIATTAALFYGAGALANIGKIGELPNGAPESWFLPMLGDIFVGAGAVIMAIVLWRRATFGAWLAAIIFHVLALADILQTIVNAVRDPWHNSPVGALMAPALGVGVLLSVVALYLLSQRDVRQHYGDNNV